MEALSACLSPSGHDAYCRVCWEPVYRLWVAKDAPDYTRCGIGDYSAQTCPNATASARTVALFAKAGDAACQCGPECRDLGALGGCRYAKATGEAGT